MQNEAEAEIMATAAESWRVTEAAERIEELERQLQVYMTQADDWEVKASSLEAEVSALSDQLDQSFDYIGELESQQPYLSWVERACWLLVGFIAAMLLVLVS